VWTFRDMIVFDWALDVRGVALRQLSKQAGRWSICRVRCGGIDDHRRWPPTLQLRSGWCVWDSRELSNMMGPYAAPRYAPCCNTAVRGGGRWTVPSTSALPALPTSFGLSDLLYIPKVPGEGGRAPMASDRGRGGLPLPVEGSTARRVAIFL
jgi:hypothetical protein